MTPTISFLLLPGTDDPHGFRRTLESLRRQLVTTWELVTPSSLARSQPSDSRVISVESGTDDGPAFLECALEHAHAPHIAVIAVGDEVEPGGLRSCVDLLTAQPGTDVLYTDERWPGPGAEGIFAKPGFSPHYLEGLPFTGRICAIRTELARSVGGFREAARGADEWDMVLRATEQATSIIHMPVVALSRAERPRVDAASTAAGKRAVLDHLRRVATPGEVETTSLVGGLRVWRTIEAAPTVTIIVPSAGGHRDVRGKDVLLLENCARSIVEKTTYTQWEFVLVLSAHAAADKIEQRLRPILRERLRIVTIEGDFNFSSSINEGARFARGSLLLLLNDDTEVIEPRWLERMVSVAQDPAVGAVGAQLLFEDGRIQHVGIAPDDTGYPIHVFGSEADHVERFGHTDLDIDYLAVTGAALLTPKDLFMQVGGFATELPLNFNDVDYCLKVGAAGRDVVVTPFAKLYHFESSTRGHTSEPSEMTFLIDHWKMRIEEDRHVNFRSSR